VDVIPSLEESAVEPVRRRWRIGSDAEPNKARRGPNPDRRVRFTVAAGTPLDGRTVARSRRVFLPLPELLLDVETEAALAGFDDILFWGRRRTGTWQPVSEAESVGNDFREPARARLAPRRRANSFRPTRPLGLAPDRRAIRAVAKLYVILNDFLKTRLLGTIRKHARGRAGVTPHPAAKELVASSGNERRYPVNGRE
jgi:hypothetical protein